MRTEQKEEKEEAGEEGVAEGEEVEEEGKTGLKIKETITKWKKLLQLKLKQRKKSGGKENSDAS